MDDLNRKLDLLLEQVNLSKQKQYGESSERMDFEGQLQFNFNEDEVTIAGKYVVESVMEDVCLAAYKRKKQKGKREEDLPVTIIEHMLPGETLSEIFGDTWRRLPDEVYKSLIYQPAKFEVEEHHVAVYCGNGSQTIRKAERPVDLLRNSIITPSVAAGIMNNKYINAIPLYRQEQEFHRNGIRTSRQVMAN